MPEVELSGLIRRGSNYIFIFSIRTELLLLFAGFFFRLIDVFFLLDALSPLNACYICVFIIYYDWGLCIFGIVQVYHSYTSRNLYMAKHMCEFDRISNVLIACDSFRMRNIFDFSLHSFTTLWLWKCSPFRSGSFLMHRWWCYRSCWLCRWRYWIYCRWHFYSLFFTTS